VQRPLLEGVDALVRLSFSLMLQADADVLLIDEVLAVGDASFQQKCADAFRAMKAAGKTIILVTHDMPAVETYCHRAMLISEGRIEAHGEPEEVASRYLQLNFSQGPMASGPGAPAADDIRLLRAWLEDESGKPINGVEHGKPIRLRAEVEITAELSGLAIGFKIDNADGLGMFEFGETVDPTGTRVFEAGERVRADITIANPFSAGRYFVHCGLHRVAEAGGDLVLYTPNATDFVVYGGDASRGLLTLEHKMDFAIDDGSEDR
jgi:hypothetical protein